MSAVAALFHASFDENLWWVDLRVLGLVGDFVFLAGGLALLGFAFRPPERGCRRTATALVAFGLACAGGVNATAFYAAWSGSRISPGTPVPLSAVVALLLTGIGVAALRTGHPPTTPLLSRAVIIGSVVLVFIVGFPLAQFAFFGTTDYRRAADVIVVPGAKVHESGVASISLRDRVDTATELYRAGLAPTIIMSGGVGEEGFDESEVMRDIALEQGVPDDAIILDHEGITSDATVANTTALFRERGDRTVMVVSHFYHLPRLQLAYQRAGYDVFTVPARESRPIPQTPWIVAREIPAFWFYFVRALFTG